MGGEASKVGADTSRLLLEVATFHGTTIRRTAARLASRTQASARFEKGLDPTLPMQAAAHLVRTLRSFQPDVTLPAPPTDAGAWEDPTHVQRLRPERVRKLLGAAVPDDEIAGHLTRLGFGVERDGDAFAVRVPSFRATKDVTIEVDLVEEVGRMHRYANVPEAPLHGAIVPPPRDARRALVRRAQDLLAGGARFHEVYSYTFVSEDLLHRLGLTGEAYVEVVNPIAEGEQRIRRGVVPSLVARLEQNRRNAGDVRLFEIGKGYLPEHANERGEPREVHELGLAWALPKADADARFDAGALMRLKGTLEDLLRGLGFDAPRWTALADGEGAGSVERPTWLHPGRALVGTLRARAGAAAVAVCVVGELEPGLAKPLGLAGELASDVALARVSLDALLAAAPSTSGYRAIPRYPGIKLDVALAVPTGVAAGTLIEAIEKAGKDLVADVQLFDLYQGERLGADRKSLAFHVLLQSDAKTLTDKEQAKFLDRLARAAEELGGELRRE
jgi:phenylalanyl-tRNA synthetase beta chain